MQKVQVNRIDQDGFFVEPVLFDVEQVRQHEAGILDLGEDIVTTQIQEGLFKPKWDGQQWLEGRQFEEILAEAKTTKGEVLKEKANETILAGFKSSALGTEHSYSFDFEAQINLLGIKGMLSDPSFQGMSWSTWEQGDVLHTKEQLQQLWDDGMGHKMFHQQRYWDLKRQVEAATTREDVTQINW